MAPQQITRKQPQDPYAQRSKQLASAVQRLRSWVGSDPSRNAELADALVELNAHRLLGHDYAAAASDTQDAVRRSADLLLSNGPIGPYTSVEDAVRYLTAVVHLAVTQAGLGLAESAGRTIASTEEVMEQLGELPVQKRLSPVTAIWALSCSARGALAAGEVGRANAYADAALTRLAESGLRTDPNSSYLAIDTDRLASDARWAAGRPGESLGFLHEAKERYDRVVDGRLREPAKLSPALADRLAEPLFGLYRDMADRLVANGDVDLGLVTRRELVALLRGLVGRRGQPAQVQLAAALTDLADDLLTSGRVDEADAAASEAAKTVPDSPTAVSARLLAASIQARVLTRTGRGGDAVLLLRTLMAAAGSDIPVAARAVALQALGDALHSTGDAESAAATDHEVDQLARDLLGPAIERDQLRSALQDAARAVVGRGMRLSGWQPVPMSASYAATTASAAPGAAEIATPPTEPDEMAAWLEAERAEAHRLELERLEQAKAEAARREAERAEAERAAARLAAEERARAERAERAETERRKAAEEADRAERKRRRAERLEEHRLEVERREAERRESERLAVERQADREAAEDEALAAALSEWRELESRGDRRRARAANEKVIDLLRPQAQKDMTTYGPQLVDALEQLSRSRLRSGDVWGSRAPAREAKALAKALNR